MKFSRAAVALLGTAALLVPAAPATAAKHTAGANPSASDGRPPGLAMQDTLRWLAPKDLVIGTAVAGGGHHEEMPYPAPFPNDEAYVDLLAAEFSSLTPENQMKWEFLRPTRDTYNFGPADAIVAFAEENDQDVRGHVLLWHSQNPEWLEEGVASGEIDADELREILREHIMTVVGRYAGQIDQWEVANEIFTDEWDGGPIRLRAEQNVFIRELGPEIIADAFRWAHEADPTAKLFLNDYAIEHLGPKSDAYYAYVQELLADGVPIHGMGFQAHLGMQYGFPGNFQENLQRFSDLGLETAVTELDVRMVFDESGEPTEEQLATQAEWYAGMLEACLAVEGCNSFTVWGTTDKYSWVPVFFSGEGAATILDEDLERKPAYYALQRTLAEASGKAKHLDRHPAFRR